MATGYWTNDGRFITTATQYEANLASPGTYKVGVNTTAITGTPTTTKTTTSTTAITPKSLTPTSPLPIVAPKTTPTYNVSSLATPTLTATPQEQKASSLSDKLGGLYDSLVGKSAYQAKQNQLYGVNTAQAAIQDLSAQLTGIKNEAAAIPLQLQQGAAERGVTTTQLGRQENSRLRTNAIAALGVSTLLAASQGQLANAQALANQAVAQKYDPILEKITALRSNLDLIANDPRTSLQDKNRALQQQAIQEQREQQVTLDKQNATEVWQIATTAASNGENFKPSGQYTSLALTLQAISAAPTKEAALQIAVETGLIQGPAGGGSEAKILGSASTGYFTYDPATGQTSPITSSGYNPGGGGGGGTGGGGGGTTSTGGTYKFTSTQLNTGSAVAGLTIDDFKSLPGEVQNFYINSKSLANAFTEALASVRNGDASPDQVKQNIQSMNIPDTVKQYLTSQVDATTPGTPESSGGILSNIWGGIKNIFGF